MRDVSKGGANTVNGLQDSAIGLANTPAAVVNGIAWTEEQVGILNPDDKLRVPYIPSPDWSKVLVTHESQGLHDASKFLGSTGTEVLTGAVIGKVGLAGKIANAEKAAEVANGVNKANKAAAAAKTADRVVDASHFADDASEAIANVSKVGKNLECPAPTNILSKGERLKIFNQRLLDTPAAKNADEAFELLGKTMDDVEDAFSGVARVDNRPEQKVKPRDKTDRQPPELSRSTPVGTKRHGVFSAANQDSIMIVQRSAQRRSARLAG